MSDKIMEYSLKLNEYRKLDDMIIIKGINYLTETNPKTGKSRTFLCTGGYLHKSMVEKDD